MSSKSKSNPKKPKGHWSQDPARKAKVRAKMRRAHRGKSRSAPRTIADGQKIVSRVQAARVLGDVSVSTVIRLEKAGRLNPIKLHPQRISTQTYYRVEEVVALASGVANASANT